MTGIAKLLSTLPGVFRHSAWLVLAMALVTLGIVIARYGLSLGSVAVQESVVFMHAALFMLCASYTLLQDNHVRIDVFYRNYSPRTRALVNIVGALLFLLPLSSTLLWFSLDYVGRAWSIGELSPDSAMPVYLLKTLQPVMAVLLGLGALAQCFNALAALTRLRRG